MILAGYLATLKKGIEFLQSHGLIGSEQSEVAEFLHKDDERLDRTVIGETWTDLSIIV